MADNDYLQKNEQLIARLTDRLAGDPELQADVARELQTHLEDAAEEFREAGLDEQQAQQQAAKAMGDPEEISQQLFQANRGRMRFRAIARWAASLALLPAAAVVVVVLVGQLCDMRSNSIFQETSPLPQTWTQYLTEEQMYILRGDPQAFGSVERAKSISDRWPDDPVYFGNYFAAVQSEFYRKDGKLPSDLWNERMALAERGEQVDPDNAFYNFVKAGWLIESACKIEDDPSRRYEMLGRDGETKSKSLWKITITDPVRFQRGLEEFRLGLAKPDFSIRTLDMLNLRRSFLPPPQSVADVIHQATMQFNTLLPSLEELRMFPRAVGAYAVDQAEKGDASAVDLARSVEQMANTMGTDSQSLIELLVAVAVRQGALANLEQVGKVMGDETLAQEAFRQRRQQEEVYRDLWNSPRMDTKELRHAGIYWGALMPAVSGYSADFEPLRTAEDFVMLKVALLVLLAGLVVLSCGFGLAVLVWTFFCRRSDDKPVLLFVGWERIGRIVLFSIVLPLVVFGLYVSWQIFRPEAYGLNYTLGRWMVELSILFVVVFVLLLSMSYRAIRQRCVEIGLPTPPAITPRKRIVLLSVAGVILLVCMAYIIGWWADSFQHESIHSEALLNKLFGKVFGESSQSPLSFVDAFMAILVAVFLLVWLLREGIALFRRGCKLFRRTFIRSAMPILCSAVIVVGLGVGGLLSLGETLAARRVVGPASMSIQAEIERSGMRQLREKFIQWRQEDEQWEAGGRDRAAGKRQ